MIPYILWPMVALCFVDIIEYVVHGVIKYGWKDLLLQYLSGSQMREVWQLYYTWDLLIISIAVWGLFRLVGEKWAMVLLAMFSVTSLFFVYSNMNYEMTLMIKRNVFCSPVGRLAELLPYAFLGLLLRRFADKLKGRGILLISIVSLAFVIILFPIYSRYYTWTTYQYGWPHQLIVAAALMLIALNTGGENSNISEKGEGKVMIVLRSCIRMLASLTPGIYCCHILVRNLIYAIAGEVFPEYPYSASSCLAVFALSAIFCFFISKSPWNLCRKAVT